MLLGNLVLFLLIGVDITDSTCSLKIWLQHLAFRLFFGTYMLKLWRIHMIVNTVGIKRVKITEMELFKKIMFYLILLLIALTIAHIFNDAKVGYIVTTSSNQSTYQPICLNLNSDVASIVLSFIYVTEAHYVILAVYYLWLTRNVPSIVNETTVLGPVLSFSVIVIIVLASVALALNIDALSTEYFISSGFILVIFCSSIYYTAKKYMVLRIEFEKSNSDINAKQKGKQAVTNKTGSVNTSAHEDLYTNTLKLLRKEKTASARVLVVQKQIQMLQGLQLKLVDDDEFVSGSHMPNSSVPNPENENRFHIMETVETFPKSEINSSTQHIQSTK